MTYAILDDSNICNGYISTFDEISNLNYIRLSDSKDPRDYIGKKYENGTWSAEKDIKEETPTYSDERQKYIRLIQDAQVLGETEEVTRLQEEWQVIKQQFEI